MFAVAELVITPGGLTEQERQARIAELVSLAAARFGALAPVAQERFRGSLTEFLRLHGLLSQVVLAPDRDLEARAVYGAWLVKSLGGEAPTRAYVDLKGKIEVEYVRVVKGVGYLAEPGPGDDDGPPGEVTLSTRSGMRPVDPVVRLSELLAQLNERYGVGATPADRSTLEGIITELLRDEEVLDAVRVNADARELVRDREIQRAIRRRFREQQREGGALAERFHDDEVLRDELMQVVLEMVQRRAPAAAEGALTAEELARLAELGVLRNGLEPRLRGFVRRTLEGAYGGQWFAELMRSVPTAERERLAGVEPEVVLRERLHLSTLVAVIERQWGAAFAAVLEGAPAAERLSRAQCVALLEVLNAHAKPIRETGLTTVRAVAAQLHRVLDRVGS